MAETVTTSANDLRKHLNAFGAVFGDPETAEHPVWKGIEGSDKLSRALDQTM